MVNEFWKNLQGSPPINSFYLTRIIYFWIVGGFFSNQLDKRVVTHEDTSHSRFSLPDYNRVGLMKGIQVKTIAQHFLLHFYECFLSFQSAKRTRAFDKH